MADENDIKISNTLAKVLDDFEKAEISYDIEEPEAIVKAKRISGNVVLYRRNPETDN